jgi:hypothetical protein
MQIPERNDIIFTLKLVILWCWGHRDRDSTDAEID